MQTFEELVKQYPRLDQQRKTHPKLAENEFTVLVNSPYVERFLIALTEGKSLKLIRAKSYRSQSHSLTFRIEPSSAGRGEEKS